MTPVINKIEAELFKARWSGYLIACPINSLRRMTSSPGFADDSFNKCCRTTLKNDTNK